MLTISHVYDEDERSALRFRRFDFDGDPAVPPAFQTRRLVVGHGPIAFVARGVSWNGANVAKNSLHAQP